MLGIDRRRAGLAAVLLALAAAAPGAAQAQRDWELSETRIGVGYVANIPNMFLGGAVHIVPAGFGGWGLYADVKFDVESPADDDGFIDSLTVAEVEGELGDQRFGQEGSWSSLNVAVVRTISPEMAVYAGGGVGWRKEYRQYFDSDRDLGVAGLYWVEDSEVSGTYLNGLAGVMLRLTGAVTAQFGAETAPPGFTLGISIMLPR